MKPFAALALVTALCLAAPAAAAPQVVVSIKPVAALVEGVMAGVAQPRVLVGGGQSLHTFAMKPSDARALNEAEVVFWVGAGLETFLEKPLRSLTTGAVVVELMDAPGVTTLRGRPGGVWEAHVDGHDRDSGTHDHDHADHDHHIDGHIWLDPANAKAMVSAAAVALSEVDGANAAIYEANAKALIARLDGLDAELRALLSPIKTRPYIVFHDGYQYFERAYGLNAAGSITVSPDRMPGARRIAEVRDKIRSLRAACVFAEAQFDPKLVDTLIAGTDARTGTLDPEASTLPASPELYFDMMRGLARALASCLGGSG
jgi:zinc transport system substrate-binding protein